MTKRDCYACGGTGRDDDNGSAMAGDRNACRYCNGTGRVRALHPHGADGGLAPRRARRRRKAPQRGG